MRRSIRGERRARAQAKKDEHTIWGQYVDALCRPWLYVDHPKMKALRDANDMYATRLWNVSLQLINASPAQEFVQMAP